ncbi:hypothetical protein OBBRIDRAFT_744490 [Obba rivulosa]|uniref:Coenzyme Q-binding protein COQ10 START domain-containing protein n=1 Tax=Obba rivulosa TaxID=1052685 RepID=A0A8E2J807_9APHY|nr:hypothetical protein OBBRIDRAFT_744490 [Obba rivulosa]
MSFLTRLAPCSSAARVLQRSFFTLPDLSSISPFSGPDGNSQDVQTYHERKILPYSQKQMYNVVADTASYPNFLPFCTSARVLNRSPLASTPATSSSSSTPPPSSMDVELTVGFMSLTESYVSKVTCRPYESLEVVAPSSTPLFKSLDTVWRFQSASPQSLHPTNAGLTDELTTVADIQRKADSGPTLVTLDLSFAFANPVHAAVSATVFGQVSKMMVKAFEERCLQLYGVGDR